ncbi:MAG: hypothetical protein R3F59_06225 [Myxococcota bacterium]
MTTLLALTGCEFLQPPPEPEPEKECTLSAKTLPGKAFVKLERTSDGKDWEEDIWARARFYSEGGKLKMKYNTRSIVDMYDYTCEKVKGEVLCKADAPDLIQWCQTLVANKGGCSPAELANLTGASVEDAKKAVDEIMPKIEKLSDAERANMVKAFSSPSNQLRGVMHVKFNKEECRLNVRDTYQTMSNGTLSELENIVGNARFVETDKDLMFDKCRDDASLVALATADATPKQGETKVDWKVGETVTFAYAGADAKAEDGCTYTMDTWSVYEPDQRGAAVEPAADGSLPYRFTETFDSKGKKLVHLTRYKACGGKEPEKIDTTCAMVNVAE